MEKHNCKKCKREFAQKREKQRYCCADCRVNDYRGTKSKWEKIINVLQDSETAKLLGFTIRGNLNG